MFNRGKIALRSLTLTYLGLLLVIPVLVIAQDGLRAGVNGCLLYTSRCV